MKTIWKFPLAIDDFNIITMPYESEPLCVQVQDEIPCIWALVGNPELKTKRTFVTYGTGHPIPGNPGKYLGTYQLDDGRLVLHVFEVTQ